jgi:hypothetical protein
VAVAWPVFGALLGAAAGSAWGIFILRPLLND